jgi:hypothetical protein
MPAYTHENILSDRINAAFQGQVERRIDAAEPGAIRGLSGALPAIWLMISACQRASVLVSYTF